MQQTTTTWEAAPPSYEAAPAELEVAAARSQMFNPRSREFLADPYATYRVLRERDPLYFDPKTRTWTVLRYRDIQAVLRDRRFGRAPRPIIELLHGKGAADEPVFRNLLQTILMLDDPDHGRLRALVTGSFNAQRMLALRPRIERIAHDLIDAMPASGEAELMQSFARALPVIVICELLGVPEGVRERFIAERMVSDRVLAPVPMSRAELDEENRRFAEFRDIFRTLCQAKRRDPGQDLLTDLVLAEAAGQLDEEELMAMIWLIFGAGHDTTVNLIGNALVALHEHPDQLALLKAQPELLPQATDELLRFTSSVQANTRQALEDVELGGELIRKGERVLCVLGSANRDPEAYADPDQLDLTRSVTKPLAFGGGMHYCLGAQLARIEGQVALGALLSRLPDLSLPALDAPDWSPSVILRGLETLPVRYSSKLEARVEPAQQSHPSARAAAGRCPLH